MTTRILDFNPLTGETVTFKYDSLEDKMQISHHQDVERILDGNKRLQNAPEITRKGIKKDMIHYASIPNVLVVKWKHEKGIDVFNPEHRKKLFRLLNDPEYAYLKTTTLHHEG